MKRLKCSIEVLFVLLGIKVNNIQHGPSLFDSQTHSTTASYGSTETFSTDFLSHPPPLCLLPWSLSTIPNQGAQPFIITLNTLLLFLSPGVGKLVKRLLKTYPSRAAGEGLIGQITGETNPLSARHTSPAIDGPCMKKRILPSTKGWTRSILNILRDTAIMSNFTLCEQLFKHDNTDLALWLLCWNKIEDQRKKKNTLSCLPRYNLSPDFGFLSYPQPRRM